MRRRQFVSMLTCAGVAALARPRSAVAAQSADRVAGPYAHANLALYFVHRRGHEETAAPQTLQEALESGTVRVHETKTVNRLEIENLGPREVFVQAGDIVKGGQQDRVLTVSLVLTPRSGRVPIDAFCVERGRWSKRGTEDESRFASAHDIIPSRNAKLALRDAGAAMPRRGPGRIQDAIWREVSEQQHKYAAAVGRPVAAPASRSSLQLTLENHDLTAAAQAYIAALAPGAAREIGDGASGFAFAVNGTLNSAEVYAAPALFAKLWPKLLRAAAIEALGEKNGATEPQVPPPSEAVLRFLSATEAAKEAVRRVDQSNRVIARETDRVVRFEAQRESGAWVHRSYLAR